MVNANALRGAVFRANPDYELVVFDRLPEAEQTSLADLKNDPAFYGVLLPKNPAAGGVKAVCRNTALLYLTLQQPGALPWFTPADEVTQLILDGVLQVSIDGDFVCGVRASGLLEPAPSGTSSPDGFLARLARQALLYVQTLDIEESLQASARLYFYNRRPISERWRRILASESAVWGYLGMEHVAARLDKHWAQVQMPKGSSTKAVPSNAGWFLWRSKNGHKNEGSSGVGYKLYVSPQPEHAAEAFRAIVENVDGARAFKVGNDALGLLRPDKLVVYFSSFDCLEQAAERIEQRLKGCPEQGVPFTAALRPEAGLLSWGIDPAPEKGALSWQERESWRLWITNRLAVALISAKRAGTTEMEPWQFAVQRLKLEHIDTGTWTPTASFAAARGE